MGFTPFLVITFVCALTSVLGFASTKVGRNAVFGFRNKYTLQNDEVWRVINERSGRSLGILGIVLTLLSLFLGIVHPMRAMFLTLLGVLMVGLLGLTLYYHMISKRIFLSLTKEGEQVIEHPQERVGAYYTLKLEAIPLVIIGGTVLVTCLMYNNLPEQIPIHFGFTGKPDRWAGKTWLTSSLFIAVQIVLYLTMTIFFVKRRDPKVLPPSLYNRIFWLKTVLITLFGIAQYSFASGLLTQATWLMPVWIFVVALVIPLAFLGWIWKELPFRKGTAP